jgi:hypothetical protein
MHTHCAPRIAGDPFGVAAVMRGTPVGKNMVTNFRGTPTIAYGDMLDFDLQEEVCAAAGITGRIISNPFAAESISWASKLPAIDIVKWVNDEVARIVARSPRNWGLGTLNPLDASQVAEGDRCLGPLGFKGIQICSSWHSRFIDGEDSFAFWEWAQDRHVPVFIRPPRAGYDDLQGRSAYQPTIHHQGSRYIAYVGHHGGSPGVPKPINSLTGQQEFNGTSILDVTDPAHPKYLVHIPGTPGNYEEGGAQMTRVCDGKTLPKGDPNKTYLLRVFGGKSHEIYDVTNPAKPILIWQREGVLNDTHKSWWESAATSHSSMRVSRDEVVRYLIVPLVTLVVFHYLFVNAFDFNTNYLRFACVLVPVGAGFTMFWNGRRGTEPAVVLALALGLIANVAMSISESLYSGDPMLPQTRFEWFNNLQFAATITLSFSIGHLLARPLRTVRRIQRRRR